jgi:hypothetical protein
MTISRHDNNTVVSFDTHAALHYLGYDPDDPKAQAVVALCTRYELDPFANHIIVLPNRPYPYVTRDGHLWLAHRSGQFDGMETLEQWTTENPWNCYAKVAVWRKDMSHPFIYIGRAPLKVFSRKRNEDIWDDQADKKAVANAEVRALKRAFPLQLPSIIDVEDDNEVSGSDSNATSAHLVDSSGPDTTSEAEVRPERTSLAHQGRVGASAPDPKTRGAEVPVGVSPQAGPDTPNSASAPRPKSPPTPPYEEPRAARGGVEGSNPKHNEREDGSGGPAAAASSAPEQDAALLPPGPRPSGATKGG